MRVSCACNFQVEQGLTMNELCWSWMNCAKLSFLFRLLLDLTCLKVDGDMSLEKDDDVSLWFFYCCVRVFVLHRFWHAPLLRLPRYTVFVEQVSSIKSSAQIWHHCCYRARNGLIHHTKWWQALTLIWTFPTHIQCWTSRFHNAIWNQLDK